MGKTLELDNSGPRREVVRLLRWSGTKVILYLRRQYDVEQFSTSLNRKHAESVRMRRFRTTTHASFRRGVVATLCLNPMVNDACDVAAMSQ